MITHAITLSHHSARAFWLSHDVDALTSLRPSKCDVLARPLPDMSVCSTLLRQNLYLADSDPVHILVSDTESRRYVSGWTYHICSADLPQGSFWRIAQQLYVTSPELSFLLMGGELTEAQMAEYATNLCASYFIEMPNRAIRPRSRQVTSIEKIGAYLHNMHAVYGRKKALCGLRWATQGSASPMETKLFLRLCIPTRQGGYGLPKPMLNYRIDPGRCGSLSEQNYYVADLCWPEYGVIVEYDGEAYHQDVSSDKRRANALEMLEWRVFSITRHEMFDAFAFDMFARQVCKALGKRFRVAGSWVKKAAELQQQLNVFSRSTSVWLQEEPSGLKECAQTIGT